MTTEQLNGLAEDVRNQGYNPSASMKDLVYDPVSGEFKQIRKGANTDEGEVVTEMTRKGFAAVEPHLFACLREDEIRQAEELLHERDEVPAYVFRRDDDVIHIRLNPEEEVFSTGFFTSDPRRLEQDSVASHSPETVILVENGNAKVFLQDGGWKEAELMLIPSAENMFSRSKGILEVDILRDKRVMIVGLGSFGSQIAIELAKAGVGSFALMDFDRVELHNLSRHTATVNDLGRLKTNVIREAILGKNPYARVDRFAVDINADLPLLYDEVGKADLVICATDNNTSRFNLSKALVEKGKVGIFGRAITRAEGGDVFRYRPGGPCYCCLVGEGDLQEEEITDVASARRDGRIAAYVSPEDAEAMVQVGLSSDIEPICNMMVKLALVELSRGKVSGISTLDEELVWNYYMWANRRERHYGNWKPMPSAGGMPTILRWYGARIEKEEGCPICGKTIILDDSVEDPGADYTGLSL